MALVSFDAATAAIMLHCNMYFNTTIEHITEINSDCKNVCMHDKVTNAN